MSVSTIHRIDRIVSSTPSLALSQIVSQSAQTNNQQLRESAPGHVHPLFTAVQEQKPTFNFQTSELDTLLAAVGIGGATVANADLYQKLATTTGSVARATTSHARLRIAEGVIYWTSIRMAHNQVATADVIVAANYDGSNNPIAASGTVALSGNLTDALKFGVGPWSINGTAVPGIKEVELNSGIQLTQEGSGSELWDTFTGIEMTQPEIIIRTVEMVNYRTYALAGNALNGTTGVTGYARKFAPTGRVANATAQHIQFLAANGVLVPQENAGEGTTPMTDTLIIHPIAASDSTLPITISTGQQIL